MPIIAPSAIIAGLCMGLLPWEHQGGKGLFHLSNISYCFKFSTPETAVRAAGLMGITKYHGGAFQA